MEVGLRIKEIREKKQISQAEFAKRVKNLNQSQICKIETGKRVLKASELPDIAAALGTSVQELFLSQN